MRREERKERKLMEQVNIDPYVSSPCTADWLISQFWVCQRIFCVVGFGTCFFMFLFFWYMFVLFLFFGTCLLFCFVFFFSLFLLLFCVENIAFFNMTLESFSPSPL